MKTSEQFIMKDRVFSLIIVHYLDKSVFIGLLDLC